MSFADYARIIAEYEEEIQDKDRHPLCNFATMTINGTPSSIIRRFFTLTYTFTNASNRKFQTVVGWAALTLLRKPVHDGGYELSHFGAICSILNFELQCGSLQKQFAHTKLFVLPPLNVEQDDPQSAIKNLCDLKYGIFYHHKELVYSMIEVLLCPMSDADHAWLTIIWLKDKTYYEAASLTKFMKIPRDEQKRAQKFYESLAKAFLTSAVPFKLKSRQPSFRDQLQADHSSDCVLIAIYKTIDLCQRCTVLLPRDRRTTPQSFKYNFAKHEDMHCVKSFLFHTLCTGQIGMPDKDTVSWQVIPGDHTMKPAATVVIGLLPSRSANSQIKIEITLLESSAMSPNPTKDLPLQVSVSECQLVKCSVSFDGPMPKLGSFVPVPKFSDKPPLLRSVIDPTNIKRKYVSDGKTAMLLDENLIDKCSNGRAPKDWFAIHSAGIHFFVRMSTFDKTPKCRVVARVNGIGEVTAVWPKGRTHSVTGEYY